MKLEGNRLRHMNTWSLFDEFESEDAGDGRVIIYIRKVGEHNSPRIHPSTTNVTNTEQGNKFAGIVPERFTHICTTIQRACI